MTRLAPWILSAAAALALAAGAAAGASVRPESESLKPVIRTDAQWQELLDPQAYRVLRHEATDIAFTGDLWNNHRKGLYRCAGCGLSLYHSDGKYESGTGWPSFWKPLVRSHLRLRPISSGLDSFSEVKCARCGGHLGHVFDDGPEPTGKRYCMDGSALKFEPAR